MESMSITFCTRSPYCTACSTVHFLLDNTTYPICPHVTAVSQEDSLIVMAKLRTRWLFCRTRGLGVNSRWPCLSLIIIYRTVCI